MTLALETPARLFDEPLPKMRARNANVAFWIRQAADALKNNGRHFTDDENHNPGDTLWEAFQFEAHDDIPMDYTLTWGVEIGIAVAAITASDPLGDHLDAVTEIMSHYLTMAANAKAEFAEERRRLGSCRTCGRA